MPNRNRVGETSASNYTHETVPTNFVEANGVRHAYRRFGKAKVALSTSRLRTAKWAARPRRCMSAASTLWKASRSLRPSNSPAQAFVSTSLALGRRKRGCSTGLRKRRKTRQISSRHTFLPSAWERPKRLQMPSCSLGLTRPLTSSVHPWRWMEGCSRANCGAKKQNDQIT